MDNGEDGFLLLSGIQHYAFCRRQWALIHVESTWSDNALTVAGQIMHQRAHNAQLTEKRNDLLISRELPVMSRKLKITGKCDVVEFRRDDVKGVRLFGRNGKWMPCPVEYKRGRPKVTDVDRLQLCAQSICLEEMLLCPVIEEAHIFYGETKRRETVPLTSELRAHVEALFTEMHKIYSRGVTPRVKPSKACNSCSLNDVCLPNLPVPVGSVQTYLDEQLGCDA